MIVIVVVVFSTLFLTDNQEFFNKADQDIKAGYTWHYVGEQNPDSNSFAITSQADGDTPKIYWKLKK
jgi:hypothetical protein